MNLITRKIATSLLIKNRRLLSTSNNHDYSKLVLVDVNDKNGYATLTFNRPPVNSFNLELLTEFSKALDEVEKNKSKGMILTSIIPNIFSVGFDLRELYRADKHTLREFWSVVQDCWLKLYGSAYPTAAAINGHNPAAGCFFSLCCEYRVMMKNSRIGMSGARLGISIPLPMIFAMKNVMSARRAELAILSATLFSTDEALRAGLIDEMAANKSDAIKKCEAYLDRFVDIPPNARGITKQTMRRLDLEEILNNRDRDVEEFVRAIQRPEAQAAFEAFLGVDKKRN